MNDEARILLKTGWENLDDKEKVRLLGLMNWRTALDYYKDRCAELEDENTKLRRRLQAVMGRRKVRPPEKRERILTARVQIENRKKGEQNALEIESPALPRERVRRDVRGEREVGSLSGEPGPGEV